VVGAAVLTIPFYEPGQSAQATAALPSVSGTEGKGAGALAHFLLSSIWAENMTLEGQTTPAEMTQAMM
jgi:hypothetical protein